MLANLFEKLKIALHDSVCSLCGIEMSNKNPLKGRFCRACLVRLGIREAYPLKEAGRFQLYAATQFNPAVKKMIYAHKFYGKSNPHVLADLLTCYWELLQLPVEKPEQVFVTPIPPHLDKKSHLESTGRRFARHFGYDYREKILHWQRDVEPQHTLGGKRRRFENVAQSMHVEKPEGTLPKYIVIVDDLTTTGATLYEAARAFHSAYGPGVRIIGLALCSVPLAFQKHLLN